MRRRSENLGGAILAIVLMAVLMPILSGRVTLQSALLGALLGAILVGGAVVLFLVVLPHLRAPASINVDRGARAVEEVSREFGGLSKVDHQSATITRRGYSGRLDLRGGFKPSTDVSFAIEGAADGHVTVTTETLGQQMMRQIGVGDFEIGDRKFDEIYAIATTNEAAARALLTPEVRTMLVALERWFPLVLRVTPSGVLLRAERVLYEPEAMEKLVGAAFLVVDSLRLPDREGVEVVGEREESLKEAACDVCGASLKLGVVVRCARCSTPHHKDCWAFNGRCAVFACGETTAR
jgi:hypothetical protein